MIPPVVGPVLICLGVLALLAGCEEASEAPPASASARGGAFQAPAPAPIPHDYLPLSLDVAEVVVDDTWTPEAGSGVHVEQEATPLPVEALAGMVRDRLLASGGAGRAFVTIEDASLVRLPDQLVGSFAIQIEIQGGAGDAPAPVVASVSGTRTLASDRAEQATADTLMRQLMNRMNVEFEYQIRHGLKDRLSGAATPAPVQTQDLAPPSGEPASPP